MKSVWNLILVAASLIGESVSAEPTSSSVSIAYIRPYGGGNTVYLQANMPAGAFCASNIFSIDLSTSAGKAMYAAALSALLAQKLVRLELLTCAATISEASQLQSLYILP